MWPYHLSRMAERFFPTLEMVKAKKRNTIARDESESWLTACSSSALRRTMARCDYIRVGFQGPVDSERLVQWCLEFVSGWPSLVKLSPLARGFLVLPVI